MYIHIYMYRSQGHALAARECPPPFVFFVTRDTTVGTPICNASRARIKAHNLLNRSPLQGYLAHKKPPPPVGPPQGPRHSPTAGS